MLRTLLVLIMFSIFQLHADHFPLKTTQKVIETSGSIGVARWCREAEKSCHHDYFAADIAAPTGTPVVAVEEGLVLWAHYKKKYGASVSVKSLDGKRFYYYAHGGKNTLHVHEGEHVLAGQELMQVGTAADAANTEPHLHIDLMDTDELIKNGITPPKDNSFSRPSKEAKLYLKNPQTQLRILFANLLE